MQINEDSRFITSKKRIPVDVKQRQLYIESYKKSGLTMTAFCHANNLALSSFSKWFNRKTKKLTTFKSLSLCAVPMPVIQSSHEECIELQFKGKGKLTFSNIKNPKLIITVVRGLIEMNLTLEAHSILLCTQPVDFRKSIDGLIDIVVAALNHDPKKGILFFITERKLNLRF